MTYTPDLYIIDEDAVNSKPIKCGTECLFKYNFQEQSTSYKACINDTSTNDIQMPYIKITNEFLSNTSNTGIIAVNFQTKNYWFDSLYLTKPGFIFTESQISALNFKNNIQEVDSSACSLAIVCTTGNNNYLTIVQTIIPRQSVANTTRSSTLSNLIMDIQNSVLRTNDKKIPDCSQDSLGFAISTVNINNLISEYDDFFFYNDVKNRTTYNLIVFSASKPILINNATVNVLEGYFSKSVSTQSPSIYKSLPGPSKKTVFKSSQKPINNLSEGEDDIYIKCQPTDQEGEILVSGQDPYAPVEQQFDLGSALNLDNNWFTSAMMGILIMLVIIKGTEFLLKTGTRGVLGN